MLNSMATKWIFRPYVFTNLNAGFTYIFKLLNDNEFYEKYEDFENWKKI